MSTLLNETLKKVPQEIWTHILWHLSSISSISRLSICSTRWRRWIWSIVPILDLSLIDEYLCQIIIERVSKAQQQSSRLLWISLPEIQDVGVKNSINTAIGIFSTLEHFGCRLEDSLGSPVGFDVLATLPNLSSLSIDVSMNLDCECIAKLRHLTSLRIYGGIAVFQLSALQRIANGLTEFAYVNCYDLDVHELREVLASLRNVKIVDLSSTAVSTGEIQALASSGAILSTIKLEDCEYITEEEAWKILSPSAQ